MNHHPVRNFIFNKSASIIPWPLLRDADCIFPVYHTVSDQNLIHIKNLYNYKSPDQFKKDLDFFLKRYKPLELSEILENLKKGTSLPKNSFHMSFDDGLREIYQVIAPILKEKGIPATFFLNSAFIDNKNIFFRYKASILIEKLSKLKNKETKGLLTNLFRNKGYKEGDLKNTLLSVKYRGREILDSAAMILNVNFSEFLEKQKPYLSSEQIEKLKKDGFTLGAHSKDHPLYAALAIEHQLMQTKESLDIISNKFSLDYKVFGFPFGEEGISKEFFNRLSADVDCFFGSAGMKKEIIPNFFHRIEMEDTSLSASEIIKSAYLKKKINQRLGRNTIKRS